MSLTQAVLQWEESIEIAVEIGKHGDDMDLDPDFDSDSEHEKTGFRSPKAYVNGIEVKGSKVLHHLADYSDGFRRRWPTPPTGGGRAV